MDEVLSLSSTWKSEDIPNEAFVFRHVHVNQRTGRIPNEAAFKLREGERGLSVNWDKYIDVKGCYILLGLTFSKTNTFINYTAFKIFKLKVENIRSIVGIEDVIHDPVFYGDPPPIGKPNNRSHSQILCSNDEEVRMNLADYCLNNFDISCCNFKVTSLDEEINILKQRLKP